MVIFDGERLIVQLTRSKDYKSILELGKNDSNFEYFADINSIALSPTKNNAKKLFELGYSFDDDSKIFLSERKSDNNFKSMDGKYELKPFQKEGVKIMLHSETNILLGDEMGLGKTPQASVYLKLKNDSFPALVVCPASLKENWKKEIKRWTGKDSFIVEGRKSESIFSLLKKYFVLIINYDILGTDNIEDKKYMNDLKEKVKILKEKRKKADDYEKRNLNKKIAIYQNIKRNFVMRVNGWVDEISKFNFKTIIGDEIQYISGIDTIRTRAMTQICFSIFESKKIFISGTPYETKTVQFYPALHILYPDYFNNEYRFKMRYCDPVKTFWGWKFEGLSNADELHDIISKFMIRRFKKDVQKELPPKIRSIIPMSIKTSDRKLYEKIDAELELSIRNKEKNSLSKLEALKQASFNAKINSMIQWIHDYLEVNDKLVVFIWHQVASNILENEFKNISVSITGKTPANQRDKLKEEFQNNSKIRLFIGNIKSAGVGLTLTASKAVAFLEFGTTAPGMEQAEDRVHRIGQEADSVLAYYLIMENSIDEQIMEVLNKRNNDLKMVLNGQAENLFEPKKEEEFSKLILAEYKKKKKIV